MTITVYTALPICYIALPVVFRAHNCWQTPFNFKGHLSIVTTTDKHIFSTNSALLHLTYSALLHLVSLLGNVGRTLCIFMWHSTLQMVAGSNWPQAAPFLHVSQLCEAVILRQPTHVHSSPLPPCVLSLPAERAEPVTGRPPVHLCWIINALGR